MNRVIICLLLIITLLPLNTFPIGKTSYTLSCRITIPSMLELQKDSEQNEENESPKQEETNTNLITTTQEITRNGKTVLLKTTTAK